MTTIAARRTLDARRDFKPIAMTKIGGHQKEPERRSERLLYTALAASGTVIYRPLQRRLELIQPQAKGTGATKRGTTRCAQRSQPR